MRRCSPQAARNLGSRGFPLRKARAWLPLVLAMGLSAPASAVAQIPTVIQGRVEDATSREPVEGARVFSADSLAAVLTDSVGSFTIHLPAPDSLVLHVERLGYRSQRFDLPEDAPGFVSVLLLEQAPIELEGVTVVSEAAIEVLTNNLKRRRNAYWGSMRAYDRAWLDRFAPIGSAFDLVRQRIPGAFPCSTDPEHLCIRGRGVTFRNPYPTARLTVCIDGWNSLGPMSELNMIPIERVALIEFYGGSGVKLYTVDWMVSRARTGRTSVMPDTPFGLAC